jgi:hypothetical protein
VHRNKLCYVKTCDALFELETRPTEGEGEDCQIEMKIILTKKEILL